MVHIKLEFMIVGHSYLPCDRAFGAIERKLKRQRAINCPDEYVEVIRKSTREGFVAVEDLIVVAAPATAVVEGDVVVGC